MAVIPSQIFFCFLILSQLAFRKAKNYLRTEFRPDISIHGRDITTSGSRQQTSAIFKFYSWFRLWPLRRHQYVILHWLTKLYANRMIADGVMTSYWFSKMAAIASHIYFRFLIWPRLTLRKIQSCRHTKFRPRPKYYYFHFWILKQTAAILKFCSRFPFWPFPYHRHVILHWHYQIVCKSDDRRRSYDAILIFQDGDRSVANLLLVFDLAI